MLTPRNRLKALANKNHVGVFELVEILREEINFADESPETHLRGYSAKKREKSVQDKLVSLARLHEKYVDAKMSKKDFLYDVVKNL